MEREPTAEKPLNVQPEESTLSSSKTRPKIFQFEEQEMTHEQQPDTLNTIKTMQIKLRQLIVYNNSSISIRMKRNNKTT